jgi:heme oxygenase (biliverdin-IX-beta and delta-forming)
MPAEAIPTDSLIRAKKRPAPATAAEGLRSQLRESTAAAHARVDSMLAGIDLRDQRSYCRFLESQAEAVLPLEATLADSGVQRLFPDWDRRFRSRVLVEDIARLGGDVQPFTNLDRLDDNAILGTMYVLEGSRLGARMLLEMVLQSPNVSVREATAYLSHGGGTRLWPDFVKTLESHAAALSDPTPVIEAARTTFALFETAMDRLRMEALLPPVSTMASTAGHP